MGHLGVDERALATFLGEVGRVFPLEAAYLVGSRARGEELKGSDYDLVLVSQRFDGMRFPDRMAAVARYWRLDAPLEAFCYTPQELSDKLGSITSIAHAMRDARRLDYSP